MDGPLLGMDSARGGNVADSLAVLSVAVAADSRGAARLAAAADVQYTVGPLYIRW